VEQENNKRKRERWKRIMAIKELILMKKARLMNKKFKIKRTMTNNKSRKWKRCLTIKSQRW
jgi:hypothetical protein